VLNIDTNQFATEQGRRILGELISPGSLIGEATITGIFGDAQNAVYGKDFAGRRCDVAFKYREFMIEPLAGIFW